MFQQWLFVRCLGAFLYNFATAQIWLIFIISGFSISANFISHCLANFLSLATVCFITTTYIYLYVQQAKVWLFRVLSNHWLISGLTFGKHL